VKPDIFQSKVLQMFMLYPKVLYSLSVDKSAFLAAGLILESVFGCLVVSCTIITGIIGRIAGF
jgi:hypothetical protein